MTDASPQLPPELRARFRVHPKSFLIWCGIGVLMLAGLGMCMTLTEDDAKTPTPAAAAKVVDDAPAQPLPPAHRWEYREGDLYGYQTELSEEDKKAGKGASDVLMFRFLGKRGDVYRLQAENGPIFSCENPCEVVKATIAGQVVDRVTYNPDTVIGGAFEDAFNGQMEPAQAPHATGADD